MIPEIVAPKACTHSPFSFFLEWKIECVELTPLSPNGDQHQISPNNILVLSREMVARINQKITKEKML